MTKLYLIRHAEAEGNVFRRLHGQFNSQLTPRGIQQTKYLQERFAPVHMDACYSSDLTRACQTAKSIYVPKGLELHPDPCFRERSVGVWEDLSYGYLENFHGEAMRRFGKDPENWWVPGAETFAECTGRFIEGMHRVAKAHSGGVVAIFCHGAILQAVLMELFFDRNPGAIPLSDNTGVSLLHYNEGSFSYEYLGDNSHIPTELSTFSVQAWWRKTDKRKEASLYFEPLCNASQIPPELILPQGELVMLGLLQGKPVGAVGMCKPEADVGVVEGMTLLPEMAGRYYGDQLLGCAVSHFRHLGCRSLRLQPGTYPDHIDRRFWFDGENLTCSIDVDGISL